MSAAGRFISTSAAHVLHAHVRTYAIASNSQHFTLLLQSMKLVTILFLISLFGSCVYAMIGAARWRSTETDSESLRALIEARQSIAQMNELGKDTIEELEVQGKLLEDVARNLKQVDRGIDTSNVYLRKMRNRKNKLGCSIC